MRGWVLGWTRREFCTKIPHLKKKIKITVAFKIFLKLKLNADNENAGI